GRRAGGRRRPRPDRGAGPPARRSGRGRGSGRGGTPGRRARAGRAGGGRRGAVPAARPRGRGPVRAPGFWYREAGPAATALAPAAALYDLAGRALRATRTPVRVPAFVICVGNLVAGGAGKTPTALAVAANL